MKGLALSEGEVICWLASEMSGEERNWERLESMLTEATEKIDVGKEGWLGRYEAVVGAMLPLDNLGRRLVVLSLIGKLEREGWLRGLDVTKSMFDALDEMNRRYASSEQREGEARMRAMGRQSWTGGLFALVESIGLLARRLWGER